MDWFPEFMKIRLEDWVNSLEWDWVISRQRYFATPIPLWECEKCEEVVLAKIKDCYIDPTVDKPPFSKCPKCGGKLVGCEDVFDTWMDSSISPLYNTFWYRDDERFKKLYPMSVRAQSHDIIRTWAFYTILRCTLITEKKPFESIMMGGFILSEDGTPMHASLGNVIDPLDIINEFGTDSFRCYAASCALGEDNPFRKKDVVRGVKLLRKIWNVEQFIGNIIKEDKPQKTNLQDIDKWILSKYSRLVKKCTELMDVFDYSQAMKETEYFLWHELADHYIEMIKSSIYSKSNEESIRYTLYEIGLGIIKLFAPFFPHLTEEIYHEIYKKFEKDASIHISKWPEEILINKEVETVGESVKNYISQIRSWKSEKGIALNAPINAISTYANKDYIKNLQNSKSVILSTLKLPSDHRFIEGKPEIQEQITSIQPNYSKIGPYLKNDSKKLIDWILKNQKDIIEKIETKGDIKLSEIPVINIKTSENLVKDDFIKLKKEAKIKGKKDISITKFDKFYLEYKDG